MTAKGPRQLADKDDLLTGFDETGPTRGQFRGFFATSIVGSIWAWDLAFSYGVYRTVSFHTRERLFVVSLAVLLGALMLRRRVRLHRWVLAAFAPPILLILLRLLVPVDPGVAPVGSRVATEAGPAVRVVEGILVVATILTSPVVLWVVARLLAPDYFILPGRRVKIALLVIVATVALIGYLVGRYNYHFLTCEEFLVAGDNAPANCVHTP
jgi:hypothetical protein